MWRLGLSVCWFALLTLLMGGSRVGAQMFILPTANTNIFNRGHEAVFFAATANPSIEPEWMSGVFGCVRNSGTRLHEGIDIRSIKRDRKKEPIDDVLAIADGEVLYVNSKRGTSSYGNYIVIGHRINGMDIVSLYAHLREIGEGVHSGLRVKQGQRIATLGRTDNTYSGFSIDRAHLHLEIALFMNSRFPAWQKKQIPDAKDYHGMFNGLNLSGLDVREIYREQRIRREWFHLARFIKSQPELCRVQVRATQFEFAKRYRPLIDVRDDLEDGAKIVGYEIALSYSGTPIRLIPRTADELQSKNKIHLLSVNEEEAKRNGCRRLVSRSGGTWKLARNGEKVFSLLLY